ncbi:MAG: ABC transporter ATP-binding protein [Alistipes sp.]|nr:ABC transporter ATP-binding protein [Alistipes sp.]MBR4051642.1 ABC transporter ATP-binding protein [Alistipes sp.]
MIRLENLTLGYADRTLLKQVSTSFEVGRLTALIGRNGSGKSTLLRALAGLNTEYEGQIMLGEEEIRQLDAHTLSTRLALVTTERVRIANLRCRDVVALGRAPYTNWIGRMQEEDRQLVEHALEVVGMSAFSDRTMDRMSDGECQRVMIARALAQQTPIILLDEPTSFLDLPNRYELCRLLSQLAHEEQKCILFSTHELDIARTMCDSIALVDNPHLHHLPTEELVQSGLIERTFGLE